MKAPIKILLLEDSPADAELISRQLKKMDLPFELKHATDEKTFRKELEEFHPSLILSDYVIPGYDGIAALRTVLKSHPAVPFIFVSGTLGEELAVDLLHQGAADYIIKDR